MTKPAEVLTRHINQLEEMIASLDSENDNPDKLNALDAAVKALKMNRKNQQEYETAVDVDGRNIQPGSTLCTSRVAGYCQTCPHCIFC